MSASESLSPGQFQHVYGRQEFNSGAVHRIEAYHENTQIGTLWWHDGAKLASTGTPGEISNIEVHPDFQRKGVASGMFAAARAVSDLHGLPEPRHSRMRTKAGDSWAKSVSPKSASSHQFPTEMFGGGYRHEYTADREFPDGSPRKKIPPASISLTVPKDWS